MRPVGDQEGILRIPASGGRLERSVGARRRKPTASWEPEREKKMRRKQEEAWNLRYKYLAHASLSQRSAAANRRVVNT